MAISKKILKKSLNPKQYLLQIARFENVLPKRNIWRNFWNSMFEILNFSPNVSIFKTYLNLSIFKNVSKIVGFSKKDICRKIKMILNQSNSKLIPELFKMLEKMLWKFEKKLRIKGIFRWLGRTWASRFDGFENKVRCRIDSSWLGFESRQRISNYKFSEWRWRFSTRRPCYGARKTGPHF